jgi:hypothetical protein
MPQPSWGGSAGGNTVGSFNPPPVGLGDPGPYPPGPPGGNVGGPIAPPTTPPSSSGYNGYGQN